VGCLDGVEVLISETFSAGIAAAGNRLRLVQTTGAGTDGIDFQAVGPAVAVCNVAGHANAIAEFAIMSMLALSRDLLRLDRSLRRGDWGDRQPRPELLERNLLLIGFGRIGQALASYARTFGMRVRALTRTPDVQRAVGVDYLGRLDAAALREHLPWADFVVVAVPAAQETRGLLGARELGMLKPSAFVVNVGRGAVIDEQPLYEALRSGQLAGAAIDVWYQYPDGGASRLPAASPFHELPNVIMTPHVAGWSNETTEYRWRTIADNVRRCAAGEPLLNVVQPARSDVKIRPLA
jgi:phosphoglycerate dehydrogenase-like enzyme